MANGLLWWPAWNLKSHCRTAGTPNFDPTQLINLSSSIQIYNDVSNCSSRRKMSDSINYYTAISRIRTKTTKIMIKSRCFSAALNRQSASYSGCHLQTVGMIPPRLSSPARGRSRSMISICWESSAVAATGKSGRRNRGAPSAGDSTR